MFVKCVGESEEDEDKMTVVHADIYSREEPV